VRWGLRPHPGTPGPDAIVARAGNERFFGLSGDDEICGGTGSDLLVGGGGRNYCDQESAGRAVTTC
jgi:Ca2+-binding RTX toxin-like protein